jgi:hypothetical protein
LKSQHFTLQLLGALFRASFQFLDLPLHREDLLLFSDTFSRRLSSASFLACSRIVPSAPWTLFRRKVPTRAWHHKPALLAQELSLCGLRLRQTPGAVSSIRKSQSATRSRPSFHREGSLELLRQRRHQAEP